MLDTHMNALQHDAAANLLVELHTQSTLGDVPHDTGLTVVELVGHTFVNRTVADNIDNLAELVVGQVLVKTDSTVAAELLFEQVPGAGSVTERVRHGPSNINLRSIFYLNITINIFPK